MTGDEWKNQKLKLQQWNDDAYWSMKTFDESNWLILYLLCGGT